MSRGPRLALRVLFLSVLASGAAGHDTWLAPRAFFVAPGTAVVFDATSHDRFPDLDFAIATDRVARSGLRLAEQARPLAVDRSEAHSLTLSATLVEAGVATAWLELKPRRLELAADKVGEYLEDIGSPPGIADEPEMLPPKRRWREEYRKLLKTFVRVGESPLDHSWSEPVGPGLELVPETDPTRLRVGDAFWLRLMKNGEPVGGLAVAATHGAPPTRRLKTTDVEGKVGFTLDASGPWLLAATELRRASKPDLEWESTFTTLTVLVPAAP